MNVVHEEVKKLVDKELAAATEKFGLHHSNHEKMAVIAEEFEECAEAVEDMRQMLQMAWGRTRDNVDGYMMDDAYGRIYNAAVDVATEAIQAAAMAQKAIAGQESGKRWQVSSDGYYPYCPICGAQPDKMTRYCAECGAKLGDESNEID